MLKFSHVTCVTHSTVNNNNYESTVSLKVQSVMRNHQS